MEPRKIKTRVGPEAIIQKEIIEFLELRKWLVKPTHGNEYQSGFPDLYCTHHTYGPRWIECKNPLKYAFTRAQLEWFPKLSANGTRIYILTAATEWEYKKLWGPENWYTFLKGFQT